MASGTVQTSFARLQKRTAMTTEPQSSAKQKKSENVQFSTILISPCRPLGTMGASCTHATVGLLTTHPGGPHRAHHRAEPIKLGRGSRTWSKRPWKCSESEIG